MLAIQIVHSSPQDVITDVDPAAEAPLIGNPQLSSVFTRVAPNRPREAYKYVRRLSEKNRLQRLVLLVSRTLPLPLTC